MRTDFARSVIKAAYERAGKRCEGIIPDTGERCNAPLAKGRWRCDHIIPDFIGGPATLENAQCLCLICDGVKTPRDQKMIAKVKRLEDREIGALNRRKSSFPKRPKPERTMTKPPLKRPQLYVERN